MINKSFPKHRHDFPADRWSIRRYKISLEFLKKHVNPGAKILDIGTPNGLGEFIQSNGFIVWNTHEQDFDDLELNSCLLESGWAVYDAVTCFEVLEHLINPMGLLTSLPGTKLVASVPLRLWFARSFKNKTNPAGWHYHEFEPWQFDWLLEKSGWTILDRELHVSPSFKPGLRTILRWFTPRYYLVYAERR
jgi:hypothetical protein